MPNCFRERPGCKDALPRRAAKERLRSKRVNATVLQQKVVNNTVTNSTSNTIMNAALNTHPDDIVQEITQLYFVHQSSFLVMKLCTRSAPLTCCGHMCLNMCAAHAPRKLQREKKGSVKMRRRKTNSNI